MALPCLVLAAALAGCTRAQSQRGVEPTWLSVPGDAFSVDSTHKSQVMALLGPPSQVITHSDGEIFYYLHESAVTRGTILLVYNTVTTTTSYDRAIFFFDRDGVLRDFSTAAASVGSPD
jgi:outer membrane protein assembly factor BamE (lipoprotein component of BamABCDE complex)